MKKDYLVLLKQLDGNLASMTFTSNNIHNIKRYRVVYKVEVSSAYSASEQILFPTAVKI